MRPDGDGGYREDRTRFTARVSRDGRLRFEDHANVQLSGLGLSFDVTEAAMRAMGDDPYAVEKLRIMDRTRETRTAMALSERSLRLRDAQRDLPRRLSRLWADGRASPAEKRLALFALWDEALEPEDDADPELAAAARAVRAIIVGFVRGELPEGGTDAFTPEELEALNRGRRSKQRFAPYAP
jgi:hypothetical protein